MKYFTHLLLFLLFVFLLLLFPKSIFAHAIGQPPFFKVDGKYAGYYNSYNNTLLTSSFFTLPQDQAPENYLAGQQINFEIDPIVLPQPLDVINHSIFSWDFGDGTKATGLKNTHVYGTPGSYIVSILDTYGNNPAKLIESALVQVVPDKNYHPPQAVITVNGKVVHDYILDVITVPFDKPVNFDASASTGSSKIVEYDWDFADGLSGDQPRASFKYNLDVQRVFPILRVKDELGLYSDTYAHIENRIPVAQYIQTSQAPLVSTSPTTSVPNTSVIDRLLLKISLLSRYLINHIFEVNLKNPLLFAAALLFVFLAGSLHAITPGHGKSMMAAFLIGKKGSNLFDVLLLATSITLTHTFIIFLLGFVFLVIDRRHTLTDVIPYFQEGGAIIVLALAANLIRNGWHNFRHHGSDHDHHIHDNQIPETDNFGKKSLLFAGFSGGIIPCVDAFALLLLSVTTGRVLLGISLVFVFSIGLASTIVIIGLLLVLGKRSFNLEDRFGRAADAYGPLFSGILLALIALHLLWK